MEETVILDACCTLNFSATGRASDLFRGMPQRFVIGTRARREAQWLSVPGSEERELVDLQPLIDQGDLAEVSLGHDDELALFVQFAAYVADGEAEAAALTVHRGYILATDDRKARRVVSDAHPSIRLTSTLELLRDWQLRAGLSEGEMADLLRRISERATYRPRRQDPLRPWWEDLLGDR